MISPQQNTRPGLFADIHVQYKLADEDKRQLPVRTGNGGLHLFSNGAAPNTLDQFPLECRLLPFSFFGLSALSGLLVLF